MTGGEATRVLYVGDGGDAERLSRALGEAGAPITIDYRIRRVSLAVGTLKRHAEYARMAWQAARESRGYDGLFFWQQYVALYYSLLTALLPLPRRRYVVYYIIFRSRKGLIGKAMEAVFARMIGRSEKTFFMSDADSLFRKLAGKWPDTLEAMSALEMRYPYIDANRDRDRTGDFFFSGGAGNRRYADIGAIATALPHERFVIACRPEDVAGLTLPANVDARHDVYGDAFAELILTSRAVILPLADPDVMSGQLVCIQAFAAKKTVLISENNAVRRWLPTLDELGFVTAYRTVEDAVAALAAFAPERAREAGARARRFYDETLMDAGSYDRLAAAIVSSFAGAPRR